MALSKAQRTFVRDGEPHPTVSAVWRRFLEGYSQEDSDLVSTPQLQAEVLL